MERGPESSDAADPDQMKEMEKDKSPDLMCDSKECVVAKVKSSTQG